MGVVEKQGGIYREKANNRRKPNLGIHINVHSPKAKTRIGWFSAPWLARFVGENGELRNITGENSTPGEPEDPEPRREPPHFQASPHVKNANLELGRPKNMSPLGSGIMVMKIYGAYCELTVGYTNPAVVSMSFRHVVLATSSGYKRNNSRGFKLGAA